MGMVRTGRIFDDWVNVSLSEELHGWFNTELAQMFIIEDVLSQAKKVSESSEFRLVTSSCAR
jgi:hypothetical protein